jgi:hypothetical protein
MSDIGAIESLLLYASMSECEQQVMLQVMGRRL